MACASTALIVGGGIGGLAAAVALARIGVKCDVVELADAPLGASLAFSGRAAEALDELGVYREAHETGMPFGPVSTAMSLRDTTGRIVSPGPQRPTWPGAKDNIAIYRPVFLDVLADAARALGVTITKGITTASTVDDESGALVSFTNGESRSYDMIVGADGIGSSTRAALFPEVGPPQPSGQWSIRWMVPGPALPDEGWYVGPVGRIGFYYMPSQDLVYVPAVVDRADPTRMSKGEVFALYTELLGSFTAPAIVELRRRLTPEADLIARPFEWILVPGPWHRGRTILIGDAAHATTAHMGMGGGMALEDAVVLAQCVASAPTLDAAYAAFMERRFDRVRTVVESSVELSRLEQENAPKSKNVALLTAALGALAQPY